MTGKSTESVWIPSASDHHWPRRTIKWWIREAGYTLVGLWLLVVVAIIGGHGTPDDHINP